MKTSMKPAIVFHLFRESPRLAEAKSDAKILEADPTSLRDHARHYIYVLCDKDSGDPLYVGGSWNPWERNRQRFLRACFKSDDFFASQGQDSFQLQIIDWVKPKGTNGWYGDVYGKSHRLEDFWIKKLKTRTKDGRWRAEHRARRNTIFLKIKLFSGRVPPQFRLDGAFH
jgi:hypothetical protein